MKKHVRAMLCATIMSASCATVAAQPPVGSNFPPPRQTEYKIQTPTRMADYFDEAGEGCLPVEPDGFLRRWMILEPISMPNRNNAVFTDSYIDRTLDSVYYKGQSTAAVPQRGQRVRMADGSTLRWHALDSRLFNVKLYRFAAALKKPVYGIIFHVVTVVDCPEPLKGVRLSAGSNSASKWWIDGKEVLLLSGDRRMVADDAMSRRIDLPRGRTVLRGAIINGPGMSDFCVRFVDEDGRPVNNISTCTTAK